MGACACVYVSGKCLSTISVVLSPFHEVRGGGGVCVEEELWPMPY